MKKRLMSIILALSMVVSMVPAAFAADRFADATEIAEDDIVYVSLGDSMTNGYGLDDYDGNTGVEDYGKQSYANQFADELGADYHAQLAMSAMRAEDLHWLLEVDYEDPAVVNVIETLAEDEALYDNKVDYIEAFNDLWYSVFTNGDFWTWHELVSDYRFDIAAYCIEGKDNGDKFSTGLVYDQYTDVEALQIVARYYQEAVKAADVISLGMGNGNFGVFMFGRIMESIGMFGDYPDEAMIYNVENALRECDPELKAAALELKDELYAIVQEEMGVAIEENPTLEALANTVIYAGVSYALNYAGSVEALLKLNPKAEVILVALMNTMDAKNEDEVEGISLGDLMGAVYVPLNAFIAGLPTLMQTIGNETYAEATFYYAEAPYVECMVDTYGDAVEGDPTDTVRDRFVDSIVYDDENDETGMVWGLLGDTVERVTLNEVVDYVALSDVEKIAFAADDSEKAMSIAMYLAFENAVIKGKDSAVTVESILGLTALFAEGADPFGPIMEEFEDAAAVVAPEKQSIVCEGLAAVVEATLETNAKKMLNGVQVDMTVSSNDIAAVIAGTGDTTIPQNAVDAICAKLTEIDYTGHGITVTEQMLNTQLDTDVKSYIAEMINSLINAETATQLCTLLVMPETLGNIVADSELAGLVALFARCIIGNGLGGHPSATGHKQLFDAVCDAYDFKDGNGGHTAKDETIDNLQQAAELAAELVAEYYDDAYAYAYQYAADNGYIDTAIGAIDGLIADINAIDLSGTQMTDEFKAEVEDDIEEIIETLETAKDLLEEADILDDASLQALLALLDEAGEAAWELVLTLEQAGIDVNDLVIIPALNEAYRILTEEIIPQIKEQLGIAIQAGAEWLQEKVCQAAEDLIEMVIEALPGIDAALYDWLYNNPDKVIAFFAEYGDEIVALAEEYSDEALGILAYIAFNYGDDLVEFVINNPEESLEMLMQWYDKYGYRVWPMIDVYLAELGVYDIIGDAFENLDDMMSALGGQIEDQIDDIIEQMKGQLEDKLEDLKGQLEDLKEQLENASDELKAEILDAIEKIEAAIEAIENAIDELNQIIEDINDTVESIIDAAGDVAEIIAALKALDNEFINEIIASLEQAYNGLLNNIFTAYNAVLSKCEIGEEINYIALGGATVAGEEYATTVADALVDELQMNVQYLADLGDATLTYQTQMEYIMANTDAIAGAELISYQLDANEIVDALVDAVMAINMGGSYASPDWNEYVDFEIISEVKAEVSAMKAELVPYLPAQVIDCITEAEADITAKLAENIDAETVEMVKPYVEQLVYSLASYAVETAEAVEAIKTINDDAAIVLVGMYNMLDGVVVKLNGADIDLGEYFDYVVEAVDVYNMIYAVASGNVTVVDASEAPVAAHTFDTADLMGLYAQFEDLMASLNGITDFDQISAVMDQIDNIKAQIEVALAGLNGILSNTANEAGMAYIADQIASVVTVADHTWGAWETTETTHKHTCTVCGKPEEGQHEFGTDNICDICAYEKSVAPSGSVGGGGGSSAPVNPFTDVNPNDYFYKAVMWAVQKGVTAGTSKTTFSPHMECTRGQIITFLWRAAGSPAAKNTVNPFTDVNASDYYYNAVMWAVENGITAGTSETTFSPDMVCTRAQIMTFLWRAQGSKTVSGTNPFVDVAADAYYEDAVMWAVKNDVTAGTGANTFSPDAECTRAQAVTFLWKCYK